MTFKEKLEKFLEEPVGFRLKSKEIAEELAKVLDGDDRFRDVEGWGWEALCDKAWNVFGDKALVVYDAASNFYGHTDAIGDMIRPVDVTLEELKEYNG